MRSIDKTEITVGLRLTKKEYERYKERGKGRYLRQFLQDDSLNEIIIKDVARKVDKDFTDENNTLGAIGDMFGMGD